MKTVWTIDSHTAGEGTRLVIQGLPPLRGATMVEKLVFAQENYPYAPQALLLEPHGHQDLYGAILTEPCAGEADLGVVFMSNQGYEPMCGHGLIGVVTSVLESGIFPLAEPITSLMVDTAAGLISTQAAVVEGHVRWVAFENVPCFALKLDEGLTLADGRSLKVDVAFGGNYFVLAEASKLEIDLIPDQINQLVELGMMMLSSANRQFSVSHPKIPCVDRITDVRFVGPPRNLQAHSRNVVVLGDHMVDRSPCGTGTCAELAVRYARGLIKAGEPFLAESILGTQFEGQVVREVTVPDLDTPYPAIVPRIKGSAFLTGFNQLIFSDLDPFPKGFSLA